MPHIRASVTGAWLEDHAPGDRRFLKIGDVPLEDGQTLKDVTIAYQSWGELNPKKDNAILVNHAMTGCQMCLAGGLLWLVRDCHLILINIMLSVPM